MVFPSYSPLFTMGLLAERAPSSPESFPKSPSDDASTIYFTLQTGKRDTIEFRSFLYLDLADHKCRAPSHRRKYSTLSKSTSWTCITDAKSMYDFARTEKPTPPPVPARRRPSKESMRSIPSPKPAPSATLPDLPVSPVSSPSSPSPPSASSKKRPASIVVTSPLSSTFPSCRATCHRCESISSGDRRKSRMDALECLEGRSRAPHRIPRSTLRNNFMSFSDDEDERSGVSPKPPVDDASAFADVEDEAEAIVPTARKRPQSKVVRPARPNRKRRSTLESWFPLKSFIDLKDDDLSSWNWRSFIEIGGVA